MNKQSLYKIMSENDYADMFNDIIKMATILIVVNLLMFVNNPKKKVYYLIYNESDY